MDEFIQTNHWPSGYPGAFGCNACGEWWAGDDEISEEECISTACPAYDKVKYLGSYLIEDKNNGNYIEILALGTDGQNLYMVNQVWENNKLTYSKAYEEIRLPKAQYDPQGWHKKIIQQEEIIKNLIQELNEKYDQK